MQTCFFAISGVLPREEAIAKIKAAIQATYGRKGSDLVEQNFAAVDRALEHLFEVPLPSAVSSGRQRPPVVPPEAPAFVRQVTAMMMAGRGDELPVSALPPDGTYPSATTRWEKRNISDIVPEWRPAICIQCGNCAMVCPHSAIRVRYYDESELAAAPPGFASARLAGRGFPNLRFTLQVAVEDCTGCELCVEICPAKSLEAAGTRAINMTAKAPLLERERANLAFFETLPENVPGRVDASLVRGVQYLTPLFEYSGACAGCGETPYLRLLSQLFGDRLLVANATGCSSIYGGNLPTTPWAVNGDGRGPAWANSLFEDNAEFGLGYRLSLDKHREQAVELLTALVPRLGTKRVAEIIDARQETQDDVEAQRIRVALLDVDLAAIDRPEARTLRTLSEHLVRRSVWIVGGDGWAYDIGYGGLDHVLASGRNVNILVLDTEVYSNTGGQASKSTPRGAVAKFAAGGKRGRKKDLGLMAVAYGNVYVAQIAMGASPQQTVDAFLEAEAHDGPSLIIAYSHCIAHGINMGIINTDPSVRLNATFSPVYPPSGRVAFSTQSGALGLAILEYVTRRNLGMSTFASIGNKADVSSNDLIQFWANDERTDVILLYLESFGNPRKFAQIARRVGRRKPIVAVKAGRSSAGARAATSHTGARATSDALIHTLLRQSGVIRTHTLEEMFDVAALLANQPVPQSNRVAIVTNAGGPGILAADACEANGLAVTSLTSATTSALRAFLPAAASVTNPVDMIASASAEDYRRTIALVLADPNVDSLLTIFIPPIVTAAEDVAQAIQHASAGSTKPVLATFMGVQSTLAVAGIPTYTFPESAAVALARVTEYAEWRRRPAAAAPNLEHFDRESVRAAIASAIESGGGWLDPVATERLLTAAGVTVAPARVARSAVESVRIADAIGWPVVMKGLGPTLLHKTEARAVKLGLVDPTAVCDAFADLEQRLASRLEGVLVQRMPRAGDNPVAFVVASNDTSVTRVGTITVKDKAVVITQAGR